MRIQPSAPMSIYKREETENYFYSITVQGKRARGSTGTPNKQEAMRIHDELKASMWTESNAGYSWSEACIDWLKHEDRGAPDRYRIRKLAIPNKALAELTAADIKPHLSKTPSTYNREAQLVAAILNLAVRSGHATSAPLIERKTVKETRVRWLTKEEWGRLYNELPEHLKPLAAFSIHTGLRQANATHLTWQQVDLRRKVMWVFGDSMKGGKAVGIPLSEEAVTVLKSQRGKDATWVFPYRRKYKDKSREKNEPISKIKGAWMKALERAKIKGFAWHGLRHTWATWHVMSGTPLEVLQKLGGWESMEMLTKHYAHFAPTFIAGYANNAKPYSTVTETVTDAA